MTEEETYALPLMTEDVTNARAHLELALNKK